MRTILIAMMATSAAVASPAAAQSGQWSGGGQWQGQGQGQRQWQGQTGGGQWTGGAVGGGQWQGQRVGGDPRTWGPGNGGNWQGGGRWGGTVDGRWYGGAYAPGGWNSYRRAHRGWSMPGYWRQPNWAINDWQVYGLQAPPQGYGWSRYYDDAILSDGNGYVYDSVADVDWQRADQPYPTGYGYPSQGYYNAPDGRYAGYDERCYRRSKGSGIGGALIGGAIGAGIGAATGGLGATLIGGGVGALAGQAVDRESRGRQVVCDYPQGGYAPGPGYYQQGGYAQGGGDSYAYADDGYAYAQAQGGSGGVVYAPQQAVVQPLYGYQEYAPGVTATATATFDFGAPTTTTTTTTTVTEEWVSRGYTKSYRPAKRRPSKVICRC